MGKFGKCLIPIDVLSFTNVPYGSVATDSQILPGCRNFGIATYTRQLFQLRELPRSLEHY